MNEQQETNTKEWAAFQYLTNCGIFFVPDDGDEFAEINLNDAMFWACSDLQEVEMSEMPELARLNRDYGWCGVLYWVVKKREWKAEDD
mgnify:FL=1